MVLSIANAIEPWTNTSIWRLYITPEGCVLIDTLVWTNITLRMCQRDHNPIKVQKTVKGPSTMRFQHSEKISHPGGGLKLAPQQKCTSILVQSK